MSVVAARALLPILALWLLAFFWGTFPGAAGAGGATASQLILLACLAAGAAGWRRLGRCEAASLVLLWLAVVLSLCFSEVPRAGRCAVALLPAFAILTRLAAHLFSADGALRAATRAMAALLAAVAACGLWGAVWGGTPGASLPLGHHNLLAVFLLVLLPAPLALWQGERPDRWLALGAAGLGLAALVATRSLGGAVGLLAGLLVFLPWRRSGGRWVRAGGVLLVAGLLAAGLLPRLLQVGEELGLSTAARWGYLEAGWRGFLAAPWLGHGPGSTPWLFSEYFAPQVGVHPPDHIVADLHNLLLQVLFELGIVGFLAAAGWLFALLRPLFAAPAPEDPFRAAVLRAARAGLVAALVFSATGFLLGVPALPFAFALLAGLGHAALSSYWVGKNAGETPAHPVVGLLLVVPALLWLLPGLRAQWAWEAARSAADPSVARRALAEAVALDPAFPLYRARLGLLAGEPAQLIRAQEDAGAVAPLALQAGLAAEAAGLPAAGELLARACDLDPFGGLAPLRLALGPAGGDDSLRVERAMRALVAEPRLVAARGWRERPEILRQAQSRLEREGSPAGWAAELLPSLALVLGPPPGATADLVLAIDRDPAEAVSLFVFRRSPWRAPLARVPVYTEALPGDLPPALLDPAMRPDFAAPACRWRPPS